MRVPRIADPLAFAAAVLELELVLEPVERPDPELEHPVVALAHEVRRRQVRSQPDPRQALLRVGDSDRDGVDSLVGHGRAPARARRVAASSITASRLQNAKRTSERPASGSS